VNVGGAVAFNATGNIVDGMTNNWVEDGEPRQNLPEDAVAEFKVRNSQFDAEYGLATAGLVETVTKSGTNNYHGTAFWYLRDKALNAQGVFEEEKPDMRRDQWGGSIGGPIIQDKMHFFFAGERTKVAEFYTVNTGQPELYSSLEGTFERPHTRTLINAKFDWQLNNEHSVFVRYAHEDEFAACSGCGGTTATSAGYDMETPRRSIVASHTWIAGPDKLNELKFQRAWNGYYIAPGGTEIWTDFGSFTPERYSRLSRQYRFPSVRYGSSFDEIGPEGRWEFRDTFTINTEKHTVKLGGHVSINDYAEENTGSVLGTYYFDQDQYFNPDDQSSIDNLTGAYLFSASLPPVNTEKPTSYYAWFIQDDWQISNNVMLNLGLRWERLWNCCNEDVTSSPEAIPFQDFNNRGDKNNWGPRLGMAWDVSGNGMSVVRAGYGLYYGHTRSLGTLNEYRNFIRYSVEVDDPSYPDPYGGQNPEDFIVGGPANVEIVDPSYVQPQAQQFTLGFSRQLTQDLALMIDGIYNYTRHDRKMRDLNPRDPVTGERPINEYQGNEFARIRSYESTGYVKYKAVYVKLEKRYSNRNQYMVSYTLANSDDNNPLGSYIDEFDPTIDDGPSKNERRHTIVASGSILLPWDITLGGILQYRSQLPWSATAGRDLNRNGSSSDLVPGTTRNSGSRDLDLGTVNDWRAQNDLSPVPESQLESSRIINVDIRVSKAFRLGDSTRIELMAQAFNLFNTTNLQGLFSGGRVTNSLSSSFGQILAARPNRQVELAIKFVF